MLACVDTSVVSYIQELAQVKTPDNVKMIPTSPRELAWLLAGVVYPPNADDNPELYIEDMEVAMQAQLTATQERYVSGRLLATRFIQKLLTKVCLSRLHSQIVLLDRKGQGGT